MSAARTLRRAGAALALCVAAATVGGAQAPTLANDPLDGLPIVEVPARAGTTPSTLAIFLSGDGGWATLDRQTAGELADHGVAVVGLNSRSYLMHRRTPEQTADDVARIARAYGARWGSRRLVLVGYSRGADLVPFVATRLPTDLRQRTALVAMLGPERAANFQFHWIDVVRDASRPDDRPLAPELARLRGTRLLCVYGTEEKDTACRGADSTLVRVVARDGDHHLGGDYPGLARLILDALP